MISLLDTHQHLIYRNELNYEWTKEIEPLSKKDFTIEDYKSLTEGLGIDGSLFMEAAADDYYKESKLVQYIQLTLSTKNLISN